MNALLRNRDAQFAQPQKKVMLDLSEIVCEENVDKTTCFGDSYL